MIRYTIEAADKKGWVYSVDVLYPTPAPEVRHPQMVHQDGSITQNKSKHMLQLSDANGDKPHYYVFPGLRTVKVPAVHDHYPPSERLEFILNTVVEEFSKRFEFDKEKMAAGTRKMPHGMGRMAYYYFARMQCPTLTLRQIASTFPMLKHHHTTIMHATTAIQNILDTRDPQFYEVIIAIETKLS